MHEPTNADRAARIDVTLDAYRAAQTGTKGRQPDPQDVSDLLADLMHWCRREDVDFEDELKTAGMNFDAEIDEEED